MTQALYLLALFALLAVVAVHDARTRTIPDALPLGIACLGLAGCALGLPHDVSLASRLAGAAAVGLPLAAIALASNGFGGGDVKLMTAVGWALGLQTAFAALVIGTCLGAAYGIALLAIKHASLKDAYAFGPFLCIGIVLAVVLVTGGVSLPYLADGLLSPMA